MDTTSPMNSRLLSTLSVVGGIIIGTLTTFLMMKDRFRRDVETEVTQRLTVENRLTRYDERVKSLETFQTDYARLNVENKLTRYDERIKTLESDSWTLKQQPSR